jgi:hypothetical protein
MNKMTNFSYIEYEKILNRYTPIIIDFKDVDHSTLSFCLLRHDVEFSIERALKIAKIDSDHGIKSSFFIQVLNTAYNPLSVFNSNLLKKIEGYGHHIGLHFYVSHIKEGDIDNLQNELKRQVNVLQECINTKIDRFSYHRPPSWILSVDTYKFSNLINAYSSPYFELIKNSVPDKVKYIADSNHRWNYGHPLEIEGYKCFQLLIHPDEWSENGGSDIDNFTDIINEAKNRFINNIDLEYKTFAKLRKHF